jgi:hypothetical protein
MLGLVGGSFGKTNSLRATTLKHTLFAGNDYEKLIRTNSWYSEVIVLIDFLL